MPLGRCKRRLKRLLRRPPLARVPEAESVTEPDSNIENLSRRGRQRESTKSRSKRTQRAALAIASHTFDVLQQVSDSFGPLKAVVSVVGYMKNVWQNSEEIVKQARELASDAQVFRDQVANGPGRDLYGIQTSVIQSLVGLDRDLDEIDARMKRLIVNHTGSRLLHQKEHLKDVKDAQVKFQAVKEKFMVDIIFAAYTSSISKGQEVIPPPSRFQDPVSQLQQERKGEEPLRNANFNDSCAGAAPVHLVRDERPV